MKRSRAKDPPRFGNKKTKELGFMKIIGPMERVSGIYTNP
jgi:hypothetical protein